MIYVDGLTNIVSNKSTMKKFVISDVERFSGIKAHTIRTWEQRYGFSNPQRTNGIRYYNLPEVKTILNIALLNKNGFRISAISGLPVEEIETRLSALKDDGVRKQAAVNELIISMYEMDTEKTEAVLDKCFLSWPVDTVIKDVIYAFLKTTELLWLGNRRTEEHLMVTIMRKKILWAIEKESAERRVDKTVLLFLPDTKQLDLALLYMNYQLTAKGIKVVYMGNDVSVGNLKTIFNKVKPRFLYTYLSSKHNFNIEELSACMETHLPEGTLVVTAHANGFSGKQFPVNIQNMTYDSALSFLMN